MAKKQEKTKVYGKTAYDLYIKEQADKFTKEDQQLLKDGDVVENFDLYLKKSDFEVFIVK